MVTASPAGCSGVFNITGAVNFNAAYGTIVVPPQIMIQMLYGEAHEQTVVGDSVSEPAIGIATQNRFGDSTYFPGSTTYQNTITANQFGSIQNCTQNGSCVQNGTTPELNVAAAVFSGTTTVSVANAECFFSPSATDWSNIQAALNSGTTTIPTVGTDPKCYPSSIRQFIYKSSVGNNADGRGAPAFIFVQTRNSSSSAVIQIP